MPNFQFSFEITSGSEVITTLAIIPHGYAREETKNSEHKHVVYGIYTDALLRTTESKLNVPMGGFIHPEGFRQLAKLLSDSTNTKENAELYCPDGGMKIRFQWQEDGDLNIVGQFPHADFFNNHFSLKTKFRFEFCVKASSLEKTKTDLENLLIAIEVIESGEKIEN